MTQENKKGAAFWLAFIFMSLQVLSAEDSFTNELTSNEIWQCAGSGDTLWLVTSRGVNFTNNGASPQISWSGFENVSAWASSYGGGHALLCLQTNYQDDYQPNELWHFNHAVDTKKGQIQISIALNIGKYNSENVPVVLAVDVVWTPGRFWIACMDGGLLCYYPSTGIFEHFYPGIQKTVFQTGEFQPDSSEYPDSSKQIIAVDASWGPDSTIIWAACPGGLWRFNPSDTLWEKIIDSAMGEHSYLDITVHEKNRSIFASIVVQSDETSDTNLYRYNESNAVFSKFFRPAPYVVTLDTTDRVYAVHGNQINLYYDSDSLLPHDTAAIPGDMFRNRMLKAIDVRYPEINHILYMENSASPGFWVATSNGLFYSLTEFDDEQSQAPFSYVSRKKKMVSDLGDVYAFPSIINDGTGEAVFAYNLAENDYVTIDIFDWNMDHVVCITEKQFRLSGKNRTDGRSTSELNDFWDGTVNNNNGRPVAPGVYYFRIKTKKGKRAFGKIVVAKSQPY